jgi:hypothetical protein
VQATEAKVRRKEEKKNLRAQQKLVSETNGGRGSGDDGGSGGQEDDDNTEGEDGHFDGLTTLGGPTKGPSKSMSMSDSGVPLAVASAGAKGVAPLLLNPDLPHLAAVLDKADVVIEVLDARDPLAHRSSVLEARVESKEGQKLLFLLNKIGARALILLIQCYVMADRISHRYMSSRTDRRMGCSLAFRPPNAALPCRVILSPTCRHARIDKGKRKEQGAVRRCMGL